MSLNEKLESDLIQALKSKDSVKTSTLRLVKAAITNYKIEKRKETLEDAECVDILQKQVKQRRDSISSYEQAGRADLLEKEKQELAILQMYLPQPLSSAYFT